MQLHADSKEKTLGEVIKVMPFESNVSLLRFLYLQITMSLYHRRSVTDSGSLIGVIGAFDSNEENLH